MDKAFGKIIVKYNQNSNIYVKLQDAFFAERNIAGSWQLIGYKDPSGSSTGGSTTNFTYSTDLTDTAVAAVESNADLFPNQIGCVPEIQTADTFIIFERFSGINKILT